MESRNIGCTINELVEKCFHYNSRGSSQRKRVNDSVKELSTINVGYKHTSGKCHGKLKIRIKELTQNHEATEQEIEDVYSHILMELLQ